MFPPSFAMKKTHRAPIREKGRVPRPPGPWPARKARVVPPLPPVGPDHEGIIAELELQISQFKLREQEFRQALARADENSQYHAGLFHSAPVGYLVLDDVGRILEANQSAASLLGRKREHLIHQTFT